MRQKALGLPILISLVVGNMIGTGIYLLPASLAEFGTISLVAWIFTSIGAIFLALTFANLNKKFPQSGGPYIYCREAFGDFSGFTVSLMYWLCNLTSIAGIAVAAVGYLGFITPKLNANTSVYQPYFALTIELGAVWFFTFVNMIGVRTAGTLQIFLTIIKIAPLIIISILGLSHVELHNLKEFSLSPQSDVSAISSAAALTFWAFIGLESATVPSESSSSSNDIFKATMFGAVIVALIYIFCTFVLMGMIPSDQLQNSQFPIAQAAIMLFGPKSAFVIALCAVISGFGAMNVCLLLQGQILYAGARDNYFPKFFSKYSKNKSSLSGQIFSSIIISAFLIMTIRPTLLKQFNNIALLAALLTLITYFVTTLAQIKLLVSGKKPLNKILFNKSMLISIIAAAYAFWMLTNFENKILFICAAIIVLCIPIYLTSIINTNDVAN